MAPVPIPVRFVQYLHHMGDALTVAVDFRAGSELQHAAGIGGGDDVGAGSVDGLHLVGQQRHRHLVADHVVDTRGAAANEC